MSTQSTTPDRLLEEHAQFQYDKYVYLSISADNNLILDTADGLISPVQIGAVDFNKLRDVSSTGSFISGASFSTLFNLEPGEPQSQPINIGSIGAFSEPDNSNDTLGVGAKLNVPQTKDNTVKHRYRLGMTINRVNG